MKTKVLVYNEIGFTVYYDNCYCMQFDSMKKAIKMAKDTFKHNEGMTGEYLIYIEGEDIKTLVATVTINN